MMALGGAMSKARLLTALLLTTILCAPVLAQLGFYPPSLPPPTLVRVGRLLDVRTGKYLLNQGILTEAGKIKEIGDWEKVQSHAPKDAIRIDLSKETVLPGLIDCHAHLLSSMEGNFDGGQNITIAVAESSQALRALMGAHNAKEALDAGITSARVVGHSGIDGDVALRDAINNGWVPGPRLQASARKITPPGGQAVYLQAGVSQKILEQEFLPVSGPEEARKAVRENLALGADMIKIVVDAGAGPMWKFRYLAPEDAKAIVEDAHRLGLKVAAHASDKTGIQTAIDAGVDSVEHGDEATDEQLKQMKEKGIFLAATDLFTNGRLSEYFTKFRPLPAEELAGLKSYEEQESAKSKDRLQRAMKIGVKIVAGSDMWFLWPGKTRGEATLLELEGLQKEGMPNLEIIRSATLNAAELMGWTDRVGELAPGKMADLIAVEGDPLQDITVLERVQFVMKTSRVYRNDFAKN
jgi:imidazolonepropionase-like amidohydrolase